MAGIEQQFIEWLKHRAETPCASIVTGIGDDAAVIVPSGRIVVTTDTISDGSHFVHGEHEIRRIGHKALAVSLSDLAAMGATPAVATVSYSLPRAFTLEELKELFEGSASVAAAHGCRIIGGDTNSWDGPLSISTTAIGEIPGDADSSTWRLSSGRSGDSILVTGSFGGSILNKHLDFEPRCDPAAILRRKYRINAATDVTDSLTHDLECLIRDSGCGASICLAAIPVSAAAVVLARTTGRKPLDHALYDGEDFELILTCDPETAEKILSDPEITVPISKIGVLTKGSGIIDTATGEAVPVSGYEH